MADVARGACAWCGSSRVRRSPSYKHVAFCDACGVGATVPLPTTDELAAAYRGAYRPVSGRFAGPGDAILRRSRGALARRLDRISPPGRILDVGSGDGALLAALRTRGREAEGVELAGGNGARYRDALEVEGEWAAVVFWHSLEHLRAAADVLAHVAQLLVPDGIVVVAAPNVYSLQARVFGDRWLALDPPRHVIHLSPSAASSRLEALGFEVQRVSALRGGQSVFGWLHGLVTVAPWTGDLYDAIRRPPARNRPIGRVRLTGTLLTAGALLPLAAAAAAAEASVGRGGSFYLEARRV